MGEGRSRASHNNQSQPPPTPSSKPQAPRDPGCTHSDRGSCGPQAAAASAGGASVARSVPAARLRRVPPRAPTPAAAPPLPVLLPLRQMASGSSAPSCLALAWLPTAHFPSLPALAAAAQVACHAPRGSPLCSLPCLPFACRLRDLGLYLSSSCIPESCVNVTAVWIWHSGQCGVTSY